MPTPDPRVACNLKMANVIEALDSIPPPLGDQPTPQERERAWAILGNTLTPDEITYYQIWMLSDGYGYITNFGTIIQDLRDGDC